MKRNIQFCSMIFVLAVMLLYTPLAAFAQAPTQTPEGTPQATATPSPEIMSLGEGEDVYTLIELGYPGVVMRGPYDSTRVRFSLPASWELIPGAQIRLAISNTFITTENVTQSELIRQTGAVLEVHFNGKLVENVLLDWAGQKAVIVDLPAEVLQPVRADGRHELYLRLNAAIDCDYEHQTIVEIMDQSALYLPHDIVPPPTDLSLFPRPILQRTSLLPYEVYVVVPSEPSADEMQAGLTMAATFGRLSFGELMPNLISEDLLTDAIKENAHLVLVGKANNLTSLGELDLPLPVQGDGFNFGAEQSTDGVLQMVVSAWNPAYAVMVVSGNDDQAVVKAAQAASTGVILPSDPPNLAVVEVVNPFEPPQTILVDRTLADLGYTEPETNGVGTNNLEYFFSIPYGYALSEPGYIQLVFSHSARVDYERSSLVVILNDQTIGSIPITEESIGAGLARVQVPNYVLRPGTNSLVIQSDLAVSGICVNVDIDNIWLTVNPETLIHLPLAQVEITNPSLDHLGAYPYPFSSHPSLATTAFVVPADKPTFWDTAAKLAADLANHTNGPLIELKAAFADNIPDEIRQNQDLMIVGLPEDLPILAELNDSLPAPGEPGTNRVDESALQVIYRKSESAAVGYLQLLSAPWDAQRTILVVMGTNFEGLNYAAQALIDGTLRSQLSGNFAAIKGTQIVTADTRMGEPITLPSEMVTEGTPSEPGVETTALPDTSGGGVPYQSPPWIPIAIAAASILIIVVIIAAVLSGRRSR